MAILEEIIVGTDMKEKCGRTKKKLKRCANLSNDPKKIIHTVGNQTHGSKSLILHL